MNRFIHRVIAPTNPQYSILKQASKLRYSSHVNKTIKLISAEAELTTQFQENTVTLNYKRLQGSRVECVRTLPYVWLRNSCKCPECYDAVTEENVLDLSATPIDIKPKEITQNDESESIEVTWQDGHESVYNQNQVYKYIFRNDLYKLNKASSRFLWNEFLWQSLGNAFPSVDYKSYLTDDSVLKKTLQSILKYGFVLVRNVPEEPKEIVKVCTRIAPIQDSIFGKGEVLCTNQFSFTDRAYTNAKLKPHTDNIYVKNAAGLEVFHVIKKAEEGGESVLIDGFQCANLLKELKPRSFETLSKLSVQAEYFKKDQFDLRYTDPLIKLNPIDGQLMQIRFNAYDTLNVTHLEAEEIVRFYSALKDFLQILDSKANQIWIPLMQNQILIFDNFRLLHGRSQFKGNRSLITAYISRDDWLSKAHIMGAF